MEEAVEEQEPKGEGKNERRNNIEEERKNQKIKNLLYPSAGIKYYYCHSQKS